MTTVELLQQVGLNKYEAEAYYTLLKHDALTGYEVGKHSQVPLSRSYEVLERLVEKGLALVQPGNPPRYRALEPRLFLAQMRSTMENTLNALTDSIATLAQGQNLAEFWVVRGRQAILDRARAMIEGARFTVSVAGSPDCLRELSESLKQARGCHVISRQVKQGTLLLLCDDTEALVGTAEETENAQAVASSNTALLFALRGFFTQQTLIDSAASLDTLQRSEKSWLDWEERKQRRLRHSVA
ncbi:transcriptional regulator TrmB [Thermosporothrix hazakensis]|jgi:sugar-specific transcriptional regulator TrmB|uniref:Transcriptional regulator TrmB n=2 Tax=Thermosporothrix TaxID=768650 RepID=A0A326UAB6_THEHA|nr:helix-turn-helix domain-containing protein [Thermosporothrix hazakensis]PZW29444.1 transcriptional regulator TrmB [Thermosporothrix hazakensis]BBH85730.1 hypothetical protein KTC_04810 [Thermosporothrix sp. COM3]GCE45841.1 hypothetical protein KTH_07100 [Thermosporothrix hazakensis]